MQGLKSSIAEKLNQTPRCRDSLNSSGTVSRKTSTASEYTPEHTYILNSRAQFDDQTNVSYSLESCVSATEQQTAKKSDDVKELDGNYIEESTPRTDVIISDTIDNSDLLKIELNNSLKQKHVEFLPGQKVNIVNFVMSVDKQDAPIAVAEDVKPDTIPAPVEPVEHIIPIQVEESNDDENRNNNTQEQKVEEKSQVENIRVPQRKISRFLVSPVLSGQLDLPKDKDFGGSDTQSECSENPLDTVGAILPPDLKRQDPLRKISAPLESTRTNLEMEKPEQKMSVCSLQEPAIGKEESTTVCGPELINTLEQLKISLDNLKHSNHPVHKKEPSEGDMKKLSSTVEVSSF